VVGDHGLTQPDASPLAPVPSLAAVAPLVSKPISIPAASVPELGPRQTVSNERASAHDQAPPTTSTSSTRRPSTARETPAGPARQKSSKLVLDVRQPAPGTVVAGTKPQPAPPPTPSIREALNAEPLEAVNSATDTVASNRPANDTASAPIPTDRPAAALSRSAESAAPAAAAHAVVSPPAANEHAIVD